MQSENLCVESLRSAVLGVMFGGSGTQKNAVAVGRQFYLLGESKEKAILLSA